MSSIPVYTPSVYSVPGTSLFPFPNYKYFRRTASATTTRTLIPPNRDFIGESHTWLAIPMASSKAPAPSPPKPAHPVTITPLHSYYYQSTDPNSVTLSPSLPKPSPQPVVCHLSSPDLPWKPDHKFFPNHIPSSVKAKSAPSTPGVDGVQTTFNSSSQPLLVPIASRASLFVSGRPYTALLPANPPYAGPSP